jgi:hypothetical protein
VAQTIFLVKSALCARLAGPRIRAVADLMTAVDGYRCDGLDHYRR